MTLHRDLPRQSPGSDGTTRHFLSLASLAGRLPERPRVLDLGCGPGRAALLLAAEAGARVTAVDLYEPFLDELRASASARGLSDSIRTVNADMGALEGPGFEDGSFDLVWAEGSAYNIGFATALARWKRLLAPGGVLVVSEIEWTAEQPSAGVRAFWDPQYPLRSRAENAAAAVAAGYDVLGTYLQPENDWDEYYGPLGERVATTDPAVPGMAEALAMSREEIEIRRKHGSEYGYSGYVLRPVDPRWRTRPETAADVPAVHAVNAAAFETEGEADLVEALRQDPGAWLDGLSYVAEAPDGSVAAYALITRCHVDGAPAAALAPVAVSPEFQRQGAGAAVTRAVIDAARVRGERVLLVLGHPEYYPKFGFAPASGLGIRPGFEVPDEAMMALVLDEAVEPPRGEIRYPAAFGV
ncbi:bifunctional class I SAM-dependent methyltransferase/N-acetyltransferase [Streptomyces sp. NBC_00237]|uniref:bifunctional class I SAM-dependent methyltransferase/N-acetyltransferase n=1 Tax=Streptomyces sp. NBC_00237 TaxID=2975687 RepID=UPI00225860F4|nr:bifunctional class I SAM-dependent methyltransferase/N-acetyltransferase [Streptomyces sp. NBC_00237]MCX5202880.1 bifunctional class I SAM-dependent methyltransferase/N-acetyltransferase [Streptomyces sp. NBC_00237]